MDLLSLLGQLSLHDRPEYRSKYRDLVTASAYLTRNHARYTGQGLVSAHGQLFTKFATFTLPNPVAKSQPV